MSATALATMDPTAIATVDVPQPLQPAQLRARLALIQDVMKSVMVADHDYGVIPGTDKPSLYKPGAEKLCVTFRLAAGDPVVDDHSDGYERRYRVKVPIIASSGEVLAVGVGECSSQEDKYAWRRPAHQKEYDRAPEDRRRVKYARNDDEWCQVRNNPADVANTILKMAHKRAYIHAVIMATGASSLFGQDLEDLPEETRVAGSEGVGTRRVPQPPQRKPAHGAGLSSPAPTTKASGAVTVKDVTKKTGESNGKPWTVYLVAFSDGRTASTFDEALAQAAAQAKADHVAVEVAVQAGRKEGTWNLVDLTRVEREPGSDDDAF